MVRKRFLTLVCLFVLLSVLDNTAGREIKEQHGHCKMTVRSKNERVVDLQIGEKRRWIKLKKRHLPVTSKRPSHKPADVAIFCSSDDTVACLEECINKTINENCTTRCFEQMDNGYSYIKDDKALTIENTEDELLFLDKNILEDGIPLQQKRTGTKKSGGGTQPRRTLMVPNIISINNKTGIIKLRLMVDASFMKIFVDFVNGSTCAAKTEVEYFLTLAINRVALYYASLKSLAVSFNSTNGVNFPLDLTVALESITYPHQNETDNSFYDEEVIARNKQGDGENATLVTNTIFDMNGTFIETTGLFPDFAAYMRGLFHGPTSFHIMYIITGNDLVRDEYNLTETGLVFIRRINSIGTAYIATFCRDFQQSDVDGRFGFAEFFAPYFDRTIAHELGHNLGALHDGNDRCPARNFTLMAPFAFPKVENISAGYYNFSVCSAEEIADHLSSFASDEIATCLYTNKPSVDDFLDNYCKGLLGSRYDLDDHCKLFFGKESYLCTEGSRDFANGYVPADKCQTVVNAQFKPVPLLTCAKDNRYVSTENVSQKLRFAERRPLVMREKEEVRRKRNKVHLT